MNRVAAMSELVSYRLSKTVRNRPPTTAMIRGIPIYIGGEDKTQEGATGIFDTGVLANIPDAIQQTNSDVQTLVNEVFNTAYTLDYSRDKHGTTVVANKEASDFYVNVIIPFLKDWNSFAYEHTHGWGKFKDNWVVLGGLSSWNSLNQYRRRLVDIRQASSKIVDFKSPEPAGPSVNLGQRALDQATAASKEIWKVLKVVIIVVTIAVGILAVIYIGGAM